MPQMATNNEKIITMANEKLKTSEEIKREKIRVGIIGLGFWANYGHIPILQALNNDFEIVAVSSRKKETAEACAEQFNIPNAFGNEQELISRPDVDLVIILAPGPDHYRLAKAAISAGKDIYCEWPLTTKTSDSEELLSLAEAKGVRHIVGLQRRLGPSARYTRDLIKQGYVGKIRSVRMAVGVNAFPSTMPEKYEWAFYTTNFTHVLSVYTAHFGDMLFQIVGFPKKLTAVIESQFPSFTILETGRQIPNNTPNAAMVIGTLEGGGLFSIQTEGSQQRPTGLQIEITGTEGVLRISNPLAFQNKYDNSIEGINGDETTFSPLQVPSEYQSLHIDHLDACIRDIAYLYAAHARDRMYGTSEASNFRDALKQHYFIDQVVQSSELFTY
jgi:predicted dehydrogenase